MTGTTVLYRFQVFGFFLMNDAVKLLPPVLNPVMNVLVGIKAHTAESQKIQLRRPAKVGPMFRCFPLMISCLKGSQTDVKDLRFIFQ